jgi:hypothetical protein
MTSVPALSVGGGPVVMIGTADAVVPPDPVEVVMPPSVVPVLEAVPPLVPPDPDGCPAPPVELPEVVAPPIRPEQEATINAESAPTNARDDRRCSGAFIDVLPLLSF